MPNLLARRKGAMIAVPRYTAVSTVTIIFIYTNTSQARRLQYGFLAQGSLQRVRQFYTSKPAVSISISRITVHTIHTFNHYQQPFPRFHVEKETSRQPSETPSNPTPPSPLQTASPLPTTALLRLSLHRNRGRLALLDQLVAVPQQREGGADGAGEQGPEGRDLEGLGGGAAGGREVQVQRPQEQRRVAGEQVVLEEVDDHGGEVAGRVGGGVHGARREQRVRHEGARERDLREEGRELGERGDEGGAYGPRQCGDEHDGHVGDGAERQPELVHAGHGEQESVPGRGGLARGVHGKEAAEQEVARVVQDVQDSDCPLRKI